MYDVNLKNIKKGYIFGFAFFFIGLLVFLSFLTFPLITLNNKNKYDSQAKITEINYSSYINDEGTKMYTPTYYFEVDGIEYSCKSNSSSSSKSGNKDDLIYYKSSNPNKCMTQNDLDFAKIFIFFSAIPLIFVILGIVFILKVNKKVKKAKYLAENGKLIKNLPYTMVDSNVSVNNNRLLAIAVDYTLPDGTTKHLVGEPRYDRKFEDEDQLVDLLIDPANPNNYYIDFNIDSKY